MSGSVKSITSALFIVLAAFVLVSGVGAATTVDGKPNNPYGVMMGIWGGDWSDYASINFAWANEMCGDWGYVRVSSGIHSMDIQGTVRTLAICRANKLIPVMTGLYVPEEYRKPGGADHAPFIRKDGYPLASQQYGKWAEELTKLGAVVPYYEVGNEINGKWDPEAYGWFIIDVAKALKKGMPKVKVTSAGLAGNGADFLDEVLAAVPGAAKYVDAWGLHPYCANHPPSYTKDGYAIKGHLWTKDALAKHGVTNPKFVMTESGYEIANKMDNRYPRITEELRAKYLVEAYKTVWVPDPNVATLTLFMLHTTIYPGWDGWVMVDTNCNKTETFKALAAVPKPQGSDWMPQGTCAIKGKVTDADSKQGLERVFAYTVPGIYAAQTDSKGNFVIENLPAGTYQVHIFRDGFTSPAPQKFTVSEKKPGNCTATMKRFGFFKPSFDKGDRWVDGWLPIEGNPDEHYSVDTGVKRTAGVSQKFTARPGDPVGIWQATPYASGVPDRPFAAEIWVKGKGVKLGGGKGASLLLSVTDSGAQAFSTVEVNLPLEGDFDWTPINATIPPYPPGRRLVVGCRFDAAEGTVWFADPYCHYAEYPVPSRSKFGPGTGKLSGEVTAEKNEYMAEAAVFLRPGNIWTSTRSDGTYDIENIPAGVYDVWAYRKGKMAVAKYNVKIENGKTVNLPIAIKNPPAPRDVVNGDFEMRGPAQDYTPGWIKYGEFDGIPKNGWHPEVPGVPEGFQSHTGNSFAGSIAGSNVKNGGLYQIIEVDPDKTYDVSVWSYTFQTKDALRGDVVNRLGVDPTGGTDPNGPYVIWTPYTPSQDKWIQLKLKVAPNDDRMTIFIDARQVQGAMFNVNCFDDVTVIPSAEPLPEHQFIRPMGAYYNPEKQGGAGPGTAGVNTRSDIYNPKFLWGLSAPGDDPGGAGDDIGPAWEIRKKWIEQSGVTYHSIDIGWSSAEPKRLPEGAKMEDFDWTEIDERFDTLPPRMVGMVHISLNAPWAEEIKETDEDEYWRLAERFMEFAARRGHARGFIYYRVPGNEMSLTGNPKWAELYMKPVRHYAQAIHRGHPDNQVFGGALVAGHRDLIDELYKYGFKENCDVLDIHAYATTPGEQRYNVGLSQIIESRKALVEHGDAHKRIFLGEGWSIFPLPKHIDNLKQPPTYTEEDFKHYRRAVVYGYGALTTPRPGLYDPEWVLGASFFCLNDMWGSTHWKARAEIEYDEHGDPAFWLLDGYKFPYEPHLMDPQFRTWGLIDINGEPKGDIVKHYPPYIPKTEIKVEFVDGKVDTLYPGKPYRARITFTNKEVEPFSNLRFSMDVFIGRRTTVTFNDLKTPVPATLAPGESVTHEFDIVVSPGDVGREIWAQGACEYDWNGESYYCDNWLPFKVDSPGSFTKQAYNAMPPKADQPISVIFNLKDNTGASLPKKLDVRVDGQVQVADQKFMDKDGGREYTVTFKKADAKSGGHCVATVNAGPAFPAIEVPIAFPKPGRVVEKAPARGKLINPGFEEFGPGSGYEAWEGGGSNWEEADMIKDLPNHGQRYVMRAFCGTKYPTELSQVVLVPEKFKAGNTVTASVWGKGIAQVDATDPEAIRFRISVVFLDKESKELRRDETGLLKGTGKWEKLSLTTKGAPEKTDKVKLILMYENSSDFSWHKLAMDNAELKFNIK